MSTPHIDSIAQTTRLWSQMARIGLESQMVIGLRVAGMLGLLPARPDEVQRMVREKFDAAQESTQALVQAAWRGDMPERAMRAALKPYARRTSANAERLSRAATRR